MPSLTLSFSIDCSREDDTNILVESSEDYDVGCEILTSIQDEEKGKDIPLTNLFTEKGDIRERYMNRL